MKVYQVIKAYVIYKDWLTFNNLEDDSKEITVEDLMDYIEKEIDSAFKSQYNYMQ